MSSIFIQHKVDYFWCRIFSSTFCRVVERKNNSYFHLRFSYFPLFWLHYFSYWHNSASTCTQRKSGENGRIYEKNNEIKIIQLNQSQFGAVKRFIFENDTNRNCAVHTQNAFGRCQNHNRTFKLLFILYDKPLYSKIILQMVMVAVFYTISAKYA